MAQENIAKVTPIFREVLGSRYVVVAEVELPSKYKTEGCEFTIKQLNEMGLPSGIVDFGAIMTSGNAAKNAAAALAQFNIQNPGGSLNKTGEAQKVRIQLYETVTGANPLKEQAAEAEVNKKAKLIVCIIGR